MEELSPEDACEKLRQMREQNVRDSELIVEIGENIVRKHHKSFGNEIYLICEQVFLACLDTSRFDLATMCMEKLEDNFPNSARVKKLRGIRLESIGEFDKAMKIYEELEKQDETNSSIKKRKISILKAKGNNTTAIRELTEYLKTFMTDQEAWGELSDLYIEALEYDKAAFCVEELILMNAYNHIYHQKYAEIKFTQGGVENLEMARQYFAQAIRLSNNKSMRCLYGFFMATSKLASGKNASKSTPNFKYAKWSANMITSKYRDVWENENEIIIPRSRVSDVALTASVTQLISQLQLTATS